MSGVAYLMGHGGSNPLNFSVKQYPSSGIQDPPSRNNIIAVLTDVVFNDYIFSSAKPNSASEGTIWIVTAASSNITLSVTKKNPILISIVGCKQYAQGIWKNVDAYIAIEGSWISFSAKKLYLYQSGVSDYGCIIETGGWSTYKEGNGFVEVVKERMRLECARGNDYTEVKTMSSINTTGYKHLVVETDGITPPHVPEIKIGDSYIGKMSGARTEFSLSKAYNGILKIYIYEGPDGYCTIKQVYLE